ncbi:MAG: hypothetical protein K0U18_03575 [Betaproteobacteria bacterium]|nr:hypothetical protein [Betaproteobacteria bacterium]MCH9848949.1 hypothetical protein [Betaproteobacteria bacterium]
MKLNKKLMIIALLSTMPAMAMADDVVEATSLGDAITGGQFSGNFKLRFEHVDQAGQSKTAQAFTLRSLVGYETKPLNGFSVNAQVYGLSPLNDDYNDIKKTDPITSRRAYPVIADPEDYDFHQLYVQFKNKEHQVRLGRQSFVLDNWRFIGDVRFRQNWQVMNGLSYINTSLPKTTISAAHFEQVKDITTKVWNTDVDIINANYKITPTTSVSGYGYFVDFNDTARKALSTKTFGARLDGKEKLNDVWKVLYTAEYAKQDNYDNGSSSIDNHYYRVGAGLGYGKWSLRIDQEKLSGNSNGRAFQTPLGTNHLFQGWADVFLTTPNQGIEDTMLIMQGELLGAVIKSEYHIIDSDRDFNKVGGGTGDSLGTEFDLGAYYKFNKQVSGSIEYANFQEGTQYAGARKRDIEKFWLTAMYSF